MHRGRAIFDVQKMMKTALHSINSLSEAWGNNRKLVVEPPSTLTIEQFMPGFYRSMLNQKELVGILPGRKENHVVGLTRAYHNERRDKEQVVRSDLANGFTKYIQSQPSDIQREAERGIGQWLVNKPKLTCSLKE